MKVENINSNDKSISPTWPIYFPEMIHTKNPKSNIAIITLWSKKEIYIEKLKDIDYNSIGQLYSREEGMSALIRNLLANKYITDIIMVGADLNHCSDALSSFFEKGVDKNNKIFCEYYSKIDDELPSGNIENLRNNVKFHNLRDIKNTEELKEKINKLIIKDNNKPYGNYETFKDAELKLPEVFPSDNTVYKVSGKYIKDVWIDILKIINRFGEIKKTQYGDKQKEVISMISIITDEDPKNPQMIDEFSFSMQELEDYIPQVTTPNYIEGLDYTYGQKLMNFRNINQIDNMITQLKSENYTRRAVACTWDVINDHKNPKSPCLNLIQALVQENKLYLTCYFRSNDMFGAWPRNAFALRQLQKDIAQKINCEIGSLIIISNSAHIYERAFNKSLEIVNKYENRISWKSDQYGTIIITIDKEKQKIIVHHHDKEGKKLNFIEGKTAMELYKKIGKDMMISDITHAMDIGCELQKAEIALQNNLEYIQDRPINFK